MSNTITVTQLVHYLKRRLESDFNLQGVLVEGEISNFSPYRSGHWYFSLKDENAQIRCVMFSSANSKLKFIPKDGDKIIVKGNISVYEGRGELQMTVMNMKPSGIGDLYLQYEALKKQLQEEGLFDEAHKKPIPKYPMHIALVTGKNTAARADVLTTLGRRWPIAKITEYPVLVQGTESAGQIVSALLTADQKDYDVILLVRGGGSIEDLWSFNDEALAHVIYNLNTPIITGVGHEVDFTIADFVADMRAPTPTGAAERCSPNIVDVMSTLAQCRSRLTHDVENKINTYHKQIEKYQNSTVFRMPEKLYREKLLRLESYTTQLNAAIESYRTEQSNLLLKYKQSLSSNMRSILQEEKTTLIASQMKLEHAVEIKQSESKQKLAQTIQLLNAYSPLAVLQRGYSITSYKDQPVTHVNQVHEGDKLSVRLSDGKVTATVEAVEKD